jgi:flagellar basal-body rod protein FlgF
MDNAATIVLSRMIAQQRAMDVSAVNVANADTPGFKDERVQFSDFLVRQSGTDAAPGLRTLAFTQDRATWRDPTDGALQVTGNPLDLALNGPGYFTVMTAQGPRLTRTGRFGLLPNGTVADAEGNALLDPNGRPVQVSAADTQITITADGALSSENGPIARIGVVSVANEGDLKAEGGQHFSTAAATTAVAVPKVVQGAVEGSNVQPVLEMTRMMNELREFQFASQFIQADSDSSANVIDKLLKKGT